MTNDLAFMPDDTFAGLQDATDVQTTFYGEATYAITPDLKATAGLRYFDWVAGLHRYFTGANGNSPPASAAQPIGTPLVQAGHSSANGVTPRFALQYYLTPQNNVFAEAAKGFRYGGVNQPIPTAYCGADLAAEGLTRRRRASVRTSCGAIRSAAATRSTATATASTVTAFQINWNNVQTTKYLGCSYYYTVNAGKVVSRGVELELAAQPIPRLSLDFNGSFNDAKADGRSPTSMRRTAARRPMRPAMSPA